MIIGSVAAFKLFVAAVLYLFLPLAALTYYFSRRQRRIIEVDRILKILNVDPSYATAYLPDTVSTYMLAVAYASIIARIGLVLLFFSRELCVYFGDAVKDLRRFGIRTLVDLDALSPEEIETLPYDTTVTSTVLTRAVASVRTSSEIARLREVGQLLGMFWGRVEVPGAASVLPERQPPLDRLTATL